MKDTTKYVLVVDADSETFRLLHVVLPDELWRIDRAIDPQIAAAMLREQHFDVALGDVDADEAGNLDLLSLLRQSSPQCRVILITSAGTSGGVIHAIREHVFSYFSKPFMIEAVAEMIARAAAAVDWEEGVEVLSARPGWISLRLRCRQLTADRLLQFFRELDTPLSDAERGDVATALREMLLNAIEHGGHFDPNQTVKVSYFRGTGAMIYLIQDPGEGFSFDRLPHAAVSNPPDSPAAHFLYRSQQGIRAGGFGLLFARELIDEVIHNERGNEVVLIKYLAN